MLDIIALIFLAKEIGKLAISKGLRPERWKLYLVLAWFTTELVGLVAGLIIFGPDNLISAILTGFVFAVTGYYFIKAKLNKFPDRNIIDEEKKL